MRAYHLLPILALSLLAACGGGGTGDAIALPDTEPKRLSSPQLAGLSDDFLAYVAGAPAHYTDPNRSDGVIVTADNTPADNPLSNAGAALGRVLFFDTALSLNNDTHCASCHKRDAAFGDTTAVSRRADGSSTTRNTPPLTNLRFYASGRMGWSEAQASVESQSIDAMATELSAPLAEIPARLAALDYYPPLFAAAFGDADITIERIGKALGQFQRAIISYKAKHDQALDVAGAPDWAGVYTAPERLGMALFRPVPLAEQIALGIATSAADQVQSMQCHLCHQTAAQILTVAAGATAVTTGPDEIGVGAQNIGLALSVDDQGVNDEGRFKVPSLRNVALTGPYMHDGRFATLDEVIQHYSNGVIDTPQTSDFLRVGQTPGAPVRRRPLSPSDIDAMKAFLATLSDPTIATDSRFADPFEPAN